VSSRATEGPWAEVGEERLESTLAEEEDAKVHGPLKAEQRLEATLNEEQEATDHESLKAEG
jgi:hypothetical protein